MGCAFLAEQGRRCASSRWARDSPPQARQVARQGKVELVDWYAVNGGDWQRFLLARATFLRRERRRNILVAA
jgi:hypothetical protein